ncbi:tetratricopeptide repeat protein [Psychrobacter okhotskensis]
MYQKNITPLIQPLIQPLLLATILFSGLLASACSAESSNTPILSNQSTPTEIYKLGLAYYEGDSVPEDDDKAFKLFQEAATKGYAPAQHHIGIMYHEGIGVDQDYHKAFEWVQ